MLSNIGRPLNINRRQGFILITVCWLAISLFAALPFWFSDENMSFTNSVFEAVSGITTTGSTVITELDKSSSGILLWRALLQWLGGIGIVLMAMSVLPFLKIGGMQMFKTELSETEKALPRSTQYAATVTLIYIFLTAAGFVSYHLAGMSLFDSITHSMTTLSTGGFSTHNASFTIFENPALHYIAVVFMILGGLPFVLYLKALRGNAKPLFTDSQVRFFISVVLIAILTLVVYLLKTGQADFHTALRQSTFNVVSVITGTGYANGDYNAWGGFAVSLLFFLMFAGACAGSTTCGIKIFRFQVLFAVTAVQIKKLIHPNGVFIPHYNSRPIPEGVPMSVLGFFFLYILCFAVLAIMLSFTGLDFLTAMSGAATAISNVGPALGEIIGPAGNFSTLPDSAKWILSAGMLLGRLEMFPIFVMLSVQFWQR